MYLKLDKKDLEIINRAMDITSTDYELEGDMFPLDKFISLVEDFIYEIEYKEEKINDLEGELSCWKMGGPFPEDGS